MRFSGENCGKCICHGENRFPFLAFGRFYLAKSELGKRAGRA
jgi:hypothetical protein